MDALALLEYQHRAFRKMLSRLEHDAQPGPLFDRLADALAIHSELEERVLYPATAALRTADDLQEAYVAHEEVKRLLADLLEMSEDDESFVPGLKLLRDWIDRHVEDQEGELFQATRAAFDEEQLTQMARRMEALARSLDEEGSPRVQFVATNREMQSAG